MPADHVAGLRKWIIRKAEQKHAACAKLTQAPRHAARGGEVCHGPDCEQRPEETAHYILREQPRRYGPRTTHFVEIDFHGCTRDAPDRAATGRFRKALTA